jgi:molecular chaperone IbpA
MTKATLLPRNAFLGFDHIFDQLDNIHSRANDTYPPHNVVKHDAYNYEIELAVAGFSKEHIDIEVKDHVLTIKGDRPQRRNQDLYVHKGISARNWNKSFRLSEYTEVNGADLTDGILTVNLEVVLPEEKQPRKISIRNNEVTKNDNTSSELLTESV